MAPGRHCSWISSFPSLLAQTVHLMTAEITDRFSRAWRFSTTVRYSTGWPFELAAVNLFAPRRAILSSHWELVMLHRIPSSASQLWYVSLHWGITEATGMRVARCTVASRIYVLPVAALQWSWAMTSMLSSDGILEAAVSNSAAMKISQSSVRNSMLCVNSTCWVVL